ncbi:MAG: hypothetical protein VYB61_03500 [Verrucomicrobiota bacterium]|nr:hypothetical protein [Verrucomicrobiota bacterium]
MSSDPEEKDDKGRASGPAKSPYQPRKATSMASRPIAFKAKNFISEAEKMQLQGKTHTPWESEEPAIESGRQVAYLPIILVSAMFCFAAFLFFRSQNMGTPVPEPSAPVPAAIDAPDYEQKMRTTLKDFCESGDASRIAGVIRHADRLGGIVENYYRETPPKKNRIIEARLSSNSIFLSPLEGSLLKVLVTLEGGAQRDLFLEWVGGEAKVDWGHWVCYNPVPVADFLNPASQAGTEHEFRLMGHLPAKYRTNNRFPEIRYGCVVFQDKAHDGIDFEAYVLRGTELHDQVMAYLAGNADKPLIVKLRRYSDKTKKGEGIEITGMVTEGWVRATPDVAGQLLED